jgi:P2-related tail formation protein
MDSQQNNTLAALKSLRASIREDLAFLAQDKRDFTRHSADWHSAAGSQIALRDVLDKIKILEAAAKGAK